MGEKAAHIQESDLTDTDLNTPELDFCLMIIIIYNHLLPSHHNDHGHGQHIDHNDHDHHEHSNRILLDLDDAHSVGHLGLNAYAHDHAVHTTHDPHLAHHDHNPSHCAGPAHVWTQHGHYQIPYP